MTKCSADSAWGVPLRGRLESRRWDRRPRPATMMIRNGHSMES